MSEQISVKIDYHKFAQYFKSIEFYVKGFKESRNMRSLDVIDELLKKLVKENEKIFEEMDAAYQQRVKELQEVGKFDL